MNAVYTILAALGTAAAIFAGVGALYLSVDGAYSGTNVSEVRLALLVIGVTGFLLAAVCRWAIR